MDTKTPRKEAIEREALCTYIMPEFLHASLFPACAFSCAVNCAGQERVSSRHLWSTWHGTRHSYTI